MLPQHGDRERDDGQAEVDSVVTRAKAYKLDGFRFDLMGHQPKEDMLEIRKQLNKLSLRKGGVDGKGSYLYGEGWNFGVVANDARFEQATQVDKAGTGIGTFNDRLRDAVRGGGPFDENPRVQGFGSGLYTDPNGDPVNGTPEEQKARLLLAQDLIKVGLTGNLKDYTFVDRTGSTVTGSQVDYNGQPAGYTADPQVAITYVEAHDNDRNSYDSGDWFNVLDYSYSTNGFGRGLPPRTEIRHSNPLFRLGSAQLVQQKLSFPSGGPGQALGVIVIRIDDTVGPNLDPKRRGIVVVINASDHATSQEVPGTARAGYGLHPVQASGSDPVVKTATYDADPGQFNAPARTVAVVQRWATAPSGGAVATPAPSRRHQERQAVR